MEKNLKTKHMYVYAQLNHFAIHLKHRKSTIFQFKQKFGQKMEKKKRNNLYKEFPSWRSGNESD